jgi:signal transduction histidine kinase
VSRRFDFVDAPRLELDQLLEQLIDRAQEVRASQGRLRGLLRAHQMVGTELELSAVLHQIVEAARELVGAGYAALGVIGSDGHLIEFIHSGMPEDTVATIGQLPQGKGLLGALIDTPHPIRLNRIADDTRSSGFPPGHPPMDSFLGVPIRIRGEVFGNLYLTDSDRGEFTAEDQELTLALAASAAVAIDNARLYATARVRGDWLRAAATVTHSVMTPDESANAGSGHQARGGSPPPGDQLTSDPLGLIARLCRQTADADAATVWSPTPDGQRLRSEVTDGCDDLDGLEVPADHPLFHDMLSDPTPARLNSPEAAEDIRPSGLEVGPLMILPLRDGDVVRGVVTVLRRRGRPMFATEDLEMAAGFTAQAAVALALADARSERENELLHGERDRIAADLHDQIIQRLFATGLSLHSAAAQLPAVGATQRVLDAVGELDGTISQLRTAIFALHQPMTTASVGLRAQLWQLATELTSTLGFEADLRFDGPIDTVAAPDVALDLLAVAREALTNIARHAHATRAEVDLIAADGELTLEVRDDGVGMPEGGRRSGLQNMRRRAEQRAGRFTIGSRRPRGTILTWAVPAP